MGTPNHKPMRSVHVQLNCIFKSTHQAHEPQIKRLTRQCWSNMLRCPAFSSSKCFQKHVLVYCLAGTWERPPFFSWMKKTKPSPNLRVSLSAMSHVSLLWLVVGVSIKTLTYFVSGCKSLPDLCRSVSQ